MFIYGNHAVLAWKVVKGHGKGIDLRGLCVAALRGWNHDFFGGSTGQAPAVLIIDSKATGHPARALIDMAKALGGARLNRTSTVKTARMSLKLEDHSMSANESTHEAHGMPQSPRASFWAIGTRPKLSPVPLDERDHACGNEVICVSPLSCSVSAQPAFTLGHVFQGEGLGNRWDDPNCRSSFVGHFAL